MERGAAQRTSGPPATRSLEDKEEGGGKVQGKHPPGGGFSETKLGVFDEGDGSAVSSGR